MQCKRWKKTLYHICQPCGCLLYVHCFAAHARKEIDMQTGFYCLNLRTFWCSRLCISKIFATAALWMYFELLICYLLPFHKSGLYHVIQKSLVQSIQSRQEHFLHLYDHQIYWLIKHPTVCRLCVTRSSKIFINFVFKHTLLGFTRSVNKWFH